MTNRLKKSKKAIKHRIDVRNWRKKFNAKNLTYRKIAGHYYWVPKKNF
jgi:hypothetical protein